jgi:Spx/MgsR family transcriptional regulator
MVVYGIKNCDSVKKARAFLEHGQIAYRFHDYRVDGLDAALLQTMIDALGVDALLNQRSTSWRQLSDEQKHDLTPEKALQLMLDVPTLIKRPILNTGTQWLVGFSSDLYQTLV